MDDLTQPSCAEQQLFIAVAECAKQGLDAEVVLREYCNKILKKVQEFELNSTNKDKSSPADAVQKDSNKSLSEFLC